MQGHGGIQHKRVQNVLAVAEWNATLDALQRMDEIGAQAPVAYWGVSMGTRFGVPLVATDPRIKCAALGLFGSGPTEDDFTAQALPKPSSCVTPALRSADANDTRLP